MTVRQAESLLWILTFVGLVRTAWVAAAPLRPRPAQEASRSEVSSVGGERPYPVDSLSRTIVSSDLFRLERRPAAVRYDPLTDAPGGPIHLQPIRPRPILRGVIRGDTARALIEGLPDLDGSRLVRVGEEVSGLRVTAISTGQVRLSGFDTTYVLTLRKPQ